MITINKGPFSGGRAGGRATSRVKRTMVKPQRMPKKKRKAFALEVRADGRTFVSKPYMGKDYAASYSLKPKTKQNDKKITYRLVKPDSKNMKKTRTSTMPLNMVASGKKTKVTTMDYEDMAAKIQALHARKSVPMPGASVATVVDPFPTPGIPQNDQHIPQTVVDKKRTMMKSQDMSHPRGLHRTSIETGHPSSKAVQRIAKQNGTTTTLLYDTKLITGNDISTLTLARGDLDMACGFNHKMWRFLQGISSPGVRALYTALASGFNPSTFQTWVGQATSFKFVDTRYASFRWLESKISIFNENTYLPAKVKIFCIKPKSNLDKTVNAPSSQAGGSVLHLEQIAQKVFNNIGLNTQDRFSVPASMQLASVVSSSGGAETNTSGNQSNYDKTYFQVPMDNKASLTSSAYFRDNYVIDRVISKTLEPNDTWIFTHKHHFGPGIDIDALRSQFFEVNYVDNSAATNSGFLGNDFPLGYIFMVEVRGVPCTAILGDEDALANPVLVKSTYQGTSPAQIHMEMRSKVNFVNAGIGQAGNLGSDGSDQIVHMRSFTKQDFTYGDTRRPRHVLPAFIVESEAAVTAGTAYVPIVTDKVVTGERNRGLEAHLT